MVVHFNNYNVFISLQWFLLNIVYCRKSCNVLINKKKTLLNKLRFVQVSLFKLYPERSCVPVFQNEYWSQYRTGIPKSKLVPVSAICVNSTCLTNRKQINSEKVSVDYKGGLAQTGFTVHCITYSTFFSSSLLTKMKSYLGENLSKILMQIKL